MEIILLEKIQKLGEIGTIVKVKPGYARNFLVPQGKALYATKENKEVFEEKRSNIEAENMKKIQEAKTLSSKIVNKEVILIRAASDAGQLYGSVTSKDIAKSINEKEFLINKNQILLNKSIKYLTYEKIEIKLHAEVIVEIVLNVARTSEEAKIQKQSKKAMVASDDDIKNLNADNDNSKEKKLDKEASLDKDDVLNEETDVKNKLEENSDQQLDKNKDNVLDQKTTDKEIVKDKA